MSDYKDKRLDRSEIERVIADTGVTYTIEEKSSGQHNYHITQGDKSCILTVYLKGDGRTTLTPAGRDKEIAIPICNAIIEKTSFLPLKDVNFSIIVSQEAFDKLLSTIKSKHAEDINEKEISGGFQYQFSKDKEGTFTFKYFTRTSKLQLQGKVLSFFTFLSKELEILGYDVLGKVIDDYEEIKSAPVDDILAVHLPTLHRKLSSTVKTIITPSLKLIKVNIDFSDHSIMLTPTFRVMEHVMAVILEDNGYQYNEKNGFDMFGHHAPKNMYQLRPNGSIGIAEETKNKLDKCYTFYNAHRHSLSHLGIDISEARVIKDRNKAIEILLESLELMEDLSDEFPL